MKKEDDDPVALKTAQETEALEEETETNEELPPRAISVIFNDAIYTLLYLSLFAILVKMTGGMYGYWGYVVACTVIVLATLKYYGPPTLAYIRTSLETIRSRNLPEKEEYKELKPTSLFENDADAFQETRPREKSRR